MIPGTGARVVHIKSTTGIGFVLLLLLLLCLCVDSWAGCYLMAEGDWVKVPISRVCYITGSCTGTEYAGEVSDDLGGSYNHNGSWLADDISPDEYCTGGGCRCTSDWRTQCTKTTYRVYKYRCDSQAEADSAYCAQNPTAAGCVEEDVPEACQADYSECMTLGGVWKKVGVSGSSCTSVCNLCGSGKATEFMNRLNRVCCNMEGKAPPDSAQQCRTSPSIPGEMVVSNVISFRNEVIDGCSALTTSDGEIIAESAANYKRFCIDKEEYEEQADTNDVGGGDSSSSGEGGGISDSGTSFGTELEALDGVYGVLDTIRDTLVKRLTPATEEIRDCLYSFKLCTQLDSLYVDWSAMPKDSTWFYIDTGLVKYLRPFMDASVALDSNQLKAIRKLDTNALKQLRLDSALLENDTVTRRAVNNGFDGVLKNDTATRAMVKGVKDGVDSLIDSMGRYLRAVDSSIGSVGGPGTPLGDSLGHIAGLLGGIDSALNGTGSTALSGDGYGSYGSDSSGYLGTLEGAYGDGDGASDSAYTIEGDTCSTVDCIVSNSSVKVDSLENALVESLDSSYQTIEDSSETWFNQIRQNLKFVDFDSVLVQPLREVVPNSNTCPEDCFSFNADGSSVRWLKGSFNYGVCKSWTIGGVSMNPLMVVRLILRILTAVCCIYIGLWYIGGRRG